MRSSKYTHERMAPIVAAATSLAAVLHALGLRATGGNYRYIRMRIRLLGLDTAHFRGQGWSRGERAGSHPSVARVAAHNSRPNADVFVERSSAMSRELTRRLRALGWPYACATCGTSSWRGAALSLHLDHINGIHSDNRLTNLRLLCPNCHSQTPTYCRRPPKPPSAHERPACYMSAARERGGMVDTQRLGRCA